MFTANWAGCYREAAAAAVLVPQLACHRLAALQAHALVQLLPAVALARPPEKIHRWRKVAAEKVAARQAASLRPVEKEETVAEGQ